MVSIAVIVLCSASGGQKLVQSEQNQFREEDVQMNINTLTVDPGPICLLIILLCTF